MSKLSVETNNWLINCRNSWDTLYRRSIPVYWYECEKRASASAENPNISLYQVYRNMGVANIKKCIDSDTSVIFYGNNEHEEIVKIVANPSSNPEYLKNGWAGLSSKLIIKIPNHVLLPAEVVYWLADVNNSQINTLLAENLTSDHSFFKAGKKITVSDLIDSAKTAWPDSASQSPSHFTVGIPELQFLLGVIDKYLALPDTSDNFREAFVSIDNRISNCLTVVLSQWVELGHFFPFGFVMTNDNSGKQPPCPFLDSFYADSTQHNSRAASANPKKRLATSGLRDKTSTFGPTSQVENRDPNGVIADRGGSEGMDDDYAWEHFAPRMVAYNWQSMRALRPCIKHGDHLNDHKAVQEVLGYAGTAFTDISVELEDALPWNVEKRKGNKDVFSWNYKAFTSRLLVDYPEPPHPQDRPMALTDLLAARVNEPFTSL